MIHSKRMKIAIIFLTLILLINYIFEPKKSNAEVLTGTLVALYGKEIAVALLGFILLAQASGVKFDGVKEAKAMYDKWLLDSNNWSPPPKEPGGNGWKDIIKEMLYGGAVGGALYEFIGNIKDYFQGLGSQEGENIIEGEIKWVGFDYSFYTIDKLAEENKLYFGITINGVNYDITFWGTTNHTIKLYDFKLVDVNKVSDNIIDIWIEYKMEIWLSDSGPSITNQNMKHRIYTSKPVNPEQHQNPNIIYYVTNNSYITTNNPPTTTPQPNITTIPTVPVVKPDGSVVEQFKGNTDDLIDDILENTPVTDLINPVQNGRYTIYEVDTETGTVIEIVPETGDLPFPGLENPEIPEDELKGQGIIITLLKSIVNWLYNLWKLPQKILTSLFEVPDDISLDTSKLKLNNFQLKFPFSIPWDLYKAIKVFAKSPTTPDIGIDLDTDYVKVKHKINLESIQIPLRFARYVATIFFIIYLANKTRDLIKW